MKRTRISKAQSVSEYSICVLVIILATVAMQLYLKRGLQGRYADTLEVVTTNVQMPSQGYEPYYQKEDLDFTQDVNEKKNIGIGGQVQRKIVNDLLTRQGTTEDLINEDDVTK